MLGYLMDHNFNNLSIENESLLRLEKMYYRKMEFNISKLEANEMVATDYGQKRKCEVIEEW